MTVLEAVNEILSRSGLKPVSVRDTGGNSWAAQAERLLERESLSVLSKGWNFNHVVNITWTPDGDGYIDVPDTVIWCDTYGESQHIDISNRGGRLYGRANNTSVFTGPIQVEYIERWVFECIPYPIKEYIVARSTIEFLKELQPQNFNTLIRFAVDNHDEKMSEAQAFQMEVANENIVTSNSMETVRGHRRNIYRSSG
jgi:hypothetical protein